jgi:hypothetical protein
MAVTKDNIVVIKKTPEMDITADYLARKRLLFEFPRKGYGKYDKSHVSKIKVGILGELGLLEYILDYLQREYSKIPSIERWNILHNKVGFSYLIIIGKFDGGHEFKIGKKANLLIDVKTYHDRKVGISQIFNGLKDDALDPRPLHLFIDEKQNANADIYVQAFISQEDDIILAGFNRGLPELATWMPNPAYTKAIPELESMNELLSLIKEVSV